MLTRKDFIELAKDQSELFIATLQRLEADAEVSYKCKGYVDLDVYSLGGTFCSMRGFHAWLSNVDRLMSFCEGQNSNFDIGRFMMYIHDYTFGDRFSLTDDLGKDYYHDINYLKNEALYINDSQRFEIDIHRLREAIEDVFIGRGLEIER
tara:strand:+ start:320 stop:769 length:450 start_codon:yes stop_codon:yes gene_type:complete